MIFKSNLTLLSVIVHSLRLCFSLFSKFFLSAFFVCAIFVSACVKFNSILLSYQCSCRSFQWHDFDISSYFRYSAHFPVKELCSVIHHYISHAAHFSITSAHFPVSACFSEHFIHCAHFPGTSALFSVTVLLFLVMLHTLCTLFNNKCTVHTFQSQCILSFHSNLGLEYLCTLSMKIHVDTVHAFYS